MTVRGKVCASRAEWVDDADVTFEGGEPFLDKDLPKYLEAAKRLGLTTCVVSNGGLITRPLLEDIAPNLDWLALSIDSADEEVEQRESVSMTIGLSFCSVRTVTRAG
mgnify:CR=1 FL=1